MNLGGYNEQWTLYGAKGEKLGTFSGPGFGCSDPCGSQFTFYPIETSVWFAGRLLKDANNYGGSSTQVLPDRLGTNRAYGARFYPYGDEITSTSNDREKFATYTRDSYTGLDYADQRFYASTYGRFNTPDPYMGSAGTKEPGSWNRYAYVKGDPVNDHDHSGLFDDDGNPDYCDAFPDDPQCYQPPPQPPSGPAPTQPLWTWSIDVGYTPTVNLGGNRNSYDHLFIWIHPTGDSNPADGLVFDGGPAGDCFKLQCGNVTAWSSETGHYNELTNPAAVDFYTMQLGPSDNIHAGQVLGQMILDEVGIDTSSGHSYNGFTGPNSNTVVYTELKSVGISVPIFTANLPFLGNVGVLNYQVNGQTQLFTGWGQNLLP